MSEKISLDSSEICSFVLLSEKDCFSVSSPPLNQKIRNLFCNIIETLYICIVVYAIIVAS